MTIMYFFFACSQSQSLILGPFFPISFPLTAPLSSSSLPLSFSSLLPLSSLPSLPPLSALPPSSFPHRLHAAGLGVGISVFFANMFRPLELLLFAHLFRLNVADVDLITLLLHGGHHLANLLLLLLWCSGLHTSISLHSPFSWPVITLYSWVFVSQTLFGFRWQNSFVTFSNSSLQIGGGGRWWSSTW